MIHELLKDSGAAEGLIGGEAKIYPLTGVLQPSPSPSTTTASTAAAATTITSSENQNQLRCPRCNSSNTKFCYYNNYNLTQPRHFCKTCRRYWTKGGALRNVPIGGGCRKNNKTAGLMPSFRKLSNGKLKTVVSSEIGKPSGFLDHHELIPSPFQRASPQSTHLLDFLRSTQNPNLTLNSVSAKEEGFLIGDHLSSDPGVASGSFNARTGCSSYFWRNNSQNLDQHHQQQQNGFIVGEVHNTGLSDHLYQRISLRASVNYYSDNLPAAHVGNMTCSSNSSAILESAAVAGGDQLGNNYWNYPSLSWSDLPTTNGAYP